MLDEEDHVVVYGCEQYHGSHPSHTIRGLGSFQMGGNSLTINSCEWALTRQTKKQRDSCALSVKPL